MRVSVEYINILIVTKRRHRWITVFLSLDDTHIQTNVVSTPSASPAFERPDFVNSRCAFLSTNITTWPFKSESFPVYFSIYSGATHLQSQIMDVTLGNNSDGPNSLIKFHLQSTYLHIETKHAFITAT